MEKLNKHLVKKYFKSLFYFTVLLVLFVNCKFEKTKNTSLKQVVNKQTSNSIKNSFISKCMICHETKGKTPEKMLAPPFYEIKRRYLKISINQADFIETMTDWTKNPSIDKSFMKAAIKQLGVMPQNNYSDNEIKQIVSYIYNTDFSEPLWLKTHREKHDRGIEHKH